MHAGAATIVMAVNSDYAAMLRHRRLDDGQSQTAPALRLIGDTEETIKNAFMQMRWDAWALVADGQIRLLRIGAQMDCHSAMLGAVFDGIFDQVVEHGFQAFL